MLIIDVLVYIGRDVPNNHKRDAEAQRQYDNRFAVLFNNTDIFHGYPSSSLY